ncbi:MAG TPA: hypothetical protein VF590_08050, partial [Isosphaeraceae bacterium]
MPGPTRIFRGAELPSVLALAAIMIVGWGIVFTSCGPMAVGPDRPAVVPGTAPMPPADATPEFARVTDKTPVRLGDMAAYAALLGRVRSTPSARLAASARRDVPFSQLLDRPGR